MAAQVPYQRYFLFGTRLPAREREIAILRIGWRCGADYVFGHHTLSGLEAGLSEGEILELTCESNSVVLSCKDSIIVRAVDELYDTNTISNNTWTQLSFEYNTAQLLELLSLVGRYWTVSTVVNAFGVALEPENPGFPDH